MDAKFHSECLGRDAAHLIKDGQLTWQQFRRLVADSSDELSKKMKIRKESITKGARNWGIDYSGAPRAILIDVGGLEFTDSINWSGGAVC